MLKQTWVAVEEHGDWGVIELRRADVRNAFDAHLIAELTRAALQLRDRHHLRFVVLKAEGKSFCAGADLNYMRGMAQFSVQQNLVDAEALEEMFWQLRALPMPLVARVQGHAMGGGIGLISVCDYVLAADSTQFSLSEVRLGLAPAVISPYVLEKSSGRASRMMWTGEVISAQQALSVGLVDQICPLDELDVRLSEVIARLGENGPQAMRKTKSLLRAQSPYLTDSKRLDIRELTTAVIAELRVSPEGQEGLRSFLQKGRPSWRRE